MRRAYRDVRASEAWRRVPERSDPTSRPRFSCTRAAEWLSRRHTSRAVDVPAQRRRVDRAQLSASPDWPRARRGGGRRRCAGRRRSRCATTVEHLLDASGDRAPARARRRARDRPCRPRRARRRRRHRDRPDLARGLRTLGHARVGAALAAARSCAGGRCGCSSRAPPRATTRSRTTRRSPTSGGLPAASTSRSSRSAGRSRSSTTSAARASSIGTSLHVRIVAARTACPGSAFPSASPRDTRGCGTPDMPFDVALAGSTTRRRRGRARGHARRRRARGPALARRPRAPRAAGRARARRCRRHGRARRCA